MIGRGDPTVSDRMRGTATSVMDALADSLSAHGIRHISGSLARVGNAFPDSIYGAGWEWDDLGEYYGAPVDELIFNEGMAPTTRRPPRTRFATAFTPARQGIRARHIWTRSTTR